MPEAVIVSACRTAIGTAWKGTLSETTAFTLAQAVIEEAVQRSGLAPELVDDMIFAESLYGGGAVGRYAAIEAGLTAIPGAAVNRHCAGGLTAVQLAAAEIRAGMDDAVVAGGVQSSSTAPKSRFRDPETDEWNEQWVSPAHRSTPGAPVDDMSITVGWNAAVEAGISREAMDAWALRSHRNAVAAIDAGYFDQEIVPVKVKKADGEVVVFDVDEHPRRSSTAEKLASLNVLHPEIPDFAITAGNASGINDAAAALVLTSDTFAAEHGLAPLARVRAWANVGIEPARHRPGADQRHPEGPRPGRPVDRGRRRLRDQRGLRRHVCGHRPGVGDRPGQGERERERLQPRSPDRRHRGPDGDDPRLRAASSGRRHRCGRHVRRRRHGFGDRHRGARQLRPVRAQDWSNQSHSHGTIVRSTDVNRGVSAASSGEGAHEGCRSR